MNNSIGLISIGSLGGTFTVDHDHLADTYWLFPTGGSTITLANDVTINTTNQANPLSSFYFLIKPGDFDLNGHTLTILGKSISQTQIDAGFLMFCNFSDSALTPGFTDISQITFFYSDGSTQIINGSEIVNESITLAKIEDLARGSIIRGYTSDRPTAYDAKGNAKILIGDGTDINSVSVTGDITITNAGVTAIGANKVLTTNILDDNVTNAKLANMNATTVKANITGSSANPTDVSIDTFFNTYGWSILGNSGTTAGTNFIGTTDNVDLVFKVNNLESGRIGTNGNDNVSLGYGTMTVNSGDTNSAFGYLTLANNSTGDSNTGLGAQALYANTIGLYNTAAGASALSSNTSGDANTALGNLAGAFIITGDYNTCIGRTADVDSTNAQNRIALGYGASATSNFQFAIPDDVTTIKFKGIVYTLPTVNTDGVLTNTGGVLTWA
jgi:hypothetical protein